MPTGTSNNSNIEFAPFTATQASAQATTQARVANILRREEMRLREELEPIEYRGTTSGPANSSILSYDNFSSGFTYSDSIPITYGAIGWLVKAKSDKPTSKTGKDFENYMTEKHGW